MVEQLAPVLAAEDARELQPDLFGRALVAPDSLVRRIAALGAGRIGDLRATPMILPLLTDPDTTVRVAAAFALGLLRDTAAVQPLIDRLTGLPALDATTALEAVTALAKIGGRRAGEFFGGVLAGRVALSQEDRTAARDQVLAEAWRLNADAPITGLLPFMDDTSSGPRLRAVYSLGRLRAPAAGNRMLLVLRDPEAYIRSIAARALTRSYVDSAKLAPSAVADLLVRAAEDPSPQVRINAIRSLAGFRDSTLSPKLVPMLDDQLAGVQVTAAETLGGLGGAEAVRGLTRAAAGKGVFAVRRAALLSLARVDTAAFVTAAARWRTSVDWRERAAVGEGEALIARPTAALLADKDSRVVAATLQAWSAEVNGPDPMLLAAARPLLAHRDAAVRSVAGDIVARAADPADLTSLMRMYAATRRDSFP
ncbi:MAG TPA: HEAT repeat domain-containing protein, partial [Gemmatimonadales bacterium]|nr:HEAT repeat domain-containing protein [Gemmatimonadales bacterium]